MQGVHDEKTNRGAAQYELTPIWGTYRWTQDSKQMMARDVHASSGLKLGVSLSTVLRQHVLSIVESKQPAGSSSGWNSKVSWFGTPLCPRCHL